jgi:hypothetical protein
LPAGDQLRRIAMLAQQREGLVHRPRRRVIKDRGLHGGVTGDACGKTARGEESSASSELDKGPDRP